MVWNSVVKSVSQRKKNVERRPNCRKCRSQDERRRESSSGVIWLWFTSLDHFLFFFTQSYPGAQPVSSPCWRVESLKWPFRHSPSPPGSHEHPVYVCKAALNLSRISLPSLQGFSRQSPCPGRIHTNINTVIMGVSVIAGRHFLKRVQLHAWQLHLSQIACCSWINRLTGSASHNCIETQKLKAGQFLNNHICFFLPVLLLS